ncbi:MAG: hypothetical protein JXR62_07325 [Bacilli bacterium]|nr:hypothetical protein [Bacilli bacterium]
MIFEQILMLFAGILVIILGPVTGLLFKTLRGQRLVNRVGNSVARIIYLFIGIALILISIFFVS